MDDKDLIIQEQRRAIKTLTAELDAAKADVAALLSQDRMFWKCWACARVYEDIPCQNKIRPCNAVWRGLINCAKFGTTPTFLEIVKDNNTYKEMEKEKRHAKNHRCNKPICAEAEPLPAEKL